MSTNNKDPIPRKVNFDRKLTNSNRSEKSTSTEINLDPLQEPSLQVKSTQKQKLTATRWNEITLPYDYEEKAIESTSPCDYRGPKLWIMTHTSDMLRTIFTAIRTCYSPYDQAYIAYEEYFKYLNKPDKSQQFPNDMVRLLAQVAKMRHLSTLEHVSFTFGVRCVSRATLAQFTRHRAGWSFSVQSQRYVKQSSDSKHGSFEYITPPSIKESDQKCQKKYTDVMKHIQTAYNELVDCGIKPEDARYIFPNAATTNITVTCNLRAFIDFYEKRNDSTHSQWEIKMLAEKMKEELLELEPGLEFLFNEMEQN